jgi:hypothetical protein
MAQLSFGSGNVFAVPVSGLTDMTPVQFGTLQDVSLDFSFTMKDLMGQYQFPVATARSAGKITGKAKYANFSARSFNLVFGATVTSAGQNNVSATEAGAIPATTTYTVTAANSATFVSDLGVVYAATGRAFAKVGTAPAAGQYSVAAGVYTFAAADASAAVLLNYTYTTNTGNKIAISNQLAGQQPTCKLVLSQGYNSQFTEIELNAVVFSKLALDFKNEDWTVPELDFSVFADAANNIGSFSLPTA